MEIIINIIQTIFEFIQNSGFIGVIIASGLILVESIIPVLPLIVFITINIMVLGKFLGFIISWVFTVLGCIMSFQIFKKGLGDKFDRLTENKVIINKYKKMFKNISLGKLILIIAMPFTPAFAVNIAAGLVKMNNKKYIIALLIGKLSMVYFLGFIGTSFVESFKNPMILIKMLFVMGVAYSVYIIINKVFNLE